MWGNSGRRKSGFTLIELVIIISIIGILAIVALPVFHNLTSDAKQASCQGAVGGVRSAISSFKAKTATPSGGGSARYPTLVELTTLGTVMDQSSGIPKNPYSTLAGSEATVLDADTAGKTKGQSKDGTDAVAGWYYSVTTGDFWAATESGKSL